MTELDLDKITKEWLTQCGPCDFGLVEYGCNCAEGDPRVVISRLVEEVQDLRAAAAQIAQWVEDDAADEDGPVREFATSIAARIRYSGMTPKETQ